MRFCILIDIDCRFFVLFDNLRPLNYTYKFALSDKIGRWAR